MVSEVTVLDLGRVILVDHMASDQKVTGAARVSTGKGPEFTSKGPESDQKLISYLMTEKHGTPFEHSVFQFYVKAPIFVVREWLRHRMASFNEQSGRYAEFKPEFYLPDHVRVQDPTNKQSSVVSVDEALSGEYQLAVGESSMDAYTLYRGMLERGVAREMARIVLPLNMYSSFWFTVNARSLLNFLELRNAPGAQWEIAEYARALEVMFAEVMPMTYRAFISAGRKAP